MNRYHKFWLFLQSVLVWIMLLYTQKTFAYSIYDALTLGQAKNSWSLGFGVRSYNGIYAADDGYNVDFLPVITYNGESAYVQGPQAGFYWLQRAKLKASAFIAYDFLGYNQSNSPVLAQRARPSGTTVGFGLDYDILENHRLHFDIGQDVANQHSGYQANIQWIYSQSYKSWYWALWAGINTMSPNFANYYYGIENITGVENYDVEQAWNPEVGINLRYNATKHHSIGVGISNRWWDSKIANSPAYNNPSSPSESSTYRQVMAFYQYQWLPNLESANDNELFNGVWAWRVGGGLTSDKSYGVLDALTGDIKFDHRNTGIVTLALSKRIAESIFNSPVEIWVYGGYARHLESNNQPNFNGYTLAVKSYFQSFPWSKWVGTRFGFAQGWNYTERINVVERENLEAKNDNTSKLLNFLEFSLDFNLGDITRIKELNNCFTGYALHHRSGIFASSSFYRNVDGGSNWHTLYIECLFGSGV